MATVDSTALTALNDVLRGVGKAPVTSVSATRDAIVANGVLGRVNEEVQSEEWLFNREFDVTLTPVAGVITVPTDVLQITSRGGEQFTVRNGVLYDLETNTTNEWTAIQVDLVRFLDLTALPPAPRRYIVARAARVYAESYLGATDQSNRLRAEELDARANLMNHETRTGSISLLNGWSAGRVIWNRGQPLLQ